MTDRTYRALLIANSTFPADAQNLPDLEGPRNDPALLRDALCDRDFGLFPQENVRLVVERTTAEVLRELEELLGSASSRDLLLVYYSGHGVLDQRGRFFLCARDSRSDLLRSTAVSSGALSDMVEESAAGATVILIDCCHSGAFKGGDAVGSLSGNGRFVVTSCRTGELANDAHARNHASLFTHYLVEGLLGGAPDRDSDGIVELDDLYTYVHKALLANGKQIPQKRFAGTGDVPIAVRPAVAPDLGTVPPVLDVPPTDIDPRDVEVGEALRTKDRGATTRADESKPLRMAQHSASPLPLASRLLEPATYGQILVPGPTNSGVTAIAAGVVTLGTASAFVHTNGKSADLLSRTFRYGPGLLTSVVGGGLLILLGLVALVVRRQRWPQAAILAFALPLLFVRVAETGRFSQASLNLSTPSWRFWAVPTAVLAWAAIAALITLVGPAGADRSTWAPHGMPQMLLALVLVWGLVRAFDLYNRYGSRFGSVFRPFTLVSTVGQVGVVLAIAALVWFATARLGPSTGPWLIAAVVVVPVLEVVGELWFVLESTGYYTSREPWFLVLLCVVSLLVLVAVGSADIGLSGRKSTPSLPLT